LLSGHLFFFLVNPFQSSANKQKLPLYKYVVITNETNKITHSQYIFGCKAHVNFGGVMKSLLQVFVGN
jgi:hypothetical protein